MTFDKQSSAGYLTNHMARLFASELQREILHLDLAPAQFMTLIELWSSDGLTQRELVMRLDVEQATMANTLARMERDGLIRREPHPEDRRSSVVWLTERAKTLEGPAKELASGVNHRALQGLSEEERAQFLSLTHRIITNLQKPR